MASGVQYVLSDVQGSARALMNNNGTNSLILARHDYLPFGEEINSGIGLRTTTQGYGGTDYNRQKYGLTERDDATGLDHTWFRKLESYSGRWTSPDPYNGSMAIANPQSFNRYSYTQSDPVNFVDPSGLQGYPQSPPAPIYVPRWNPGDVIVTNTWAPRSLFNNYLLPAWMSGHSPMIIGLLNGDPLPPPPIDIRPPKEIVRVIERAKSPEAYANYQLCVAREWDIFKQNVEKVVQAADKHYEEREGGWFFTIMEGIKKGFGKEDPRDPGDTRVEELQQLARNKEIDEGTKQAAEDREKAIKKNCKKT